MYHIKLCVTSIRYQILMLQWKPVLLGNLPAVVVITKVLR
jgi:hypothetical protein